MLDVNFVLSILNAFCTSSASSFRRIFRTMSSAPFMIALQPAFTTSPAYGTQPIAVSRRVTQIIISFTRFSMTSFLRHAVISRTSQACPTKGMKFSPISMRISVPVGFSLYSPCSAPHNVFQKDFSFSILSGFNSVSVFSSSTISKFPCGNSDFDDRLLLSAIFLHIKRNSFRSSSGIVSRSCL